MNKAEISGVLEELAVLLELAGENTFKVRAYQNAARAVTALPGDLGDLIAAGGLKKVKGIGESTAAKISELHATGKLAYLEEIKSRVPPGMIEMLRIPGLGPKRIRLIHDNLQINGVGELEYACRENRLLLLEGFGEKLQKKVLDGIEALRRYQGRHLWTEGAAAAAEIVSFLQKQKHVGQVEAGGSLRRRRETVGDIDILAEVPEEHRNAVASAITKAAFIEKVTGSGDTKTSIVTKNGMACDIRMVTGAEFPYAFHHFTGSREHNTAMRSRTVRMGLKMNEYGLFRGDELIPCRSEEELFKAVGLPYIPPEMRENTGEIEAGEKCVLPVLVEKRDLKGVLHIHTDWSDGRGTIEEMARAARELGFSYMGLTDHSQTAAYAGGLRPERVKEQLLEARRAEDSVGMRILRGIESDILPDGSLDYDSAVLDSFDFVIGSVHASFTMSRADMTSRIVRAMRDPHLSILGHPTGRLLLAREPYAVDLEEVLREAAELGVVVELNANPHRLDLDWTMLREAKSLGIKTAINPDAHDIDGLADIFIGLGIARKGWLEKGDVLNTFDADKALEIMNRS
jgi:DNA polymerase (family 10)